MVYGLWNGDARCVTHDMFVDILLCVVVCVLSVCYLCGGGVVCRVVFCGVAVYRVELMILMRLNRHQFVGVVIRCVECVCVVGVAECCYGVLLRRFGSGLVGRASLWLFKIFSTTTTQRSTFYYHHHHDHNYGCGL